MNVRAIFPLLAEPARRFTRHMGLVVSPVCFGSVPPRSRPEFRANRPRSKNNRESGSQPLPYSASPFTSTTCASLHERTPTRRQFRVTICCPIVDTTSGTVGGRYSAL
ncbi:hypothetical protein Bbelb_418900 [Branchiostoma belcheri]|nr:hypothetical protein Bbelb_418900 [Branchiostoma belcheri]